MIKALIAMLNKPVVSFECEEAPLDGGTVGDVRLISGNAVTDIGEKIPFKMVYKTHEKFERAGDPDSWKREYDLYISDINKTFTSAFRWPICYHAEINEKCFEIWMEYIEAPSGLELNIDMLEKAALELGRWQGRVFADPVLIETARKLKNLGDPGFLQRHYSQFHTQHMMYEYIVSADCWLAENIKKYYLEKKDLINHEKSIEYNILRSEICTLPQHLKQMIFDVDEKQDEIFEKFKQLPIVLCQRDYWNENIFYDNGNIIVIDWDTTGWGYFGEDIAQLIFDDIDTKYFDEYVEKLIPTYYEGFTEFANITENDIINSKASIPDFIIILFGYWKVQAHIFSENAEDKLQAEKALQVIYDLRSRFLK